MKALLTQFIGGGQTRDEVITATGSGSQKMEKDPAGTDASSFIGLMMGFLGMNEKPAPAANGEGAAPSEANKEGQKPANLTSSLGMLDDISGNNNSKAAILKSREGETKSKNSLLSTAEKLNSRPGGQTAEGGAAPTLSATFTTVGEGSLRKGIDGETAKKPAESSADKVPPQLKTKGEALEANKIKAEKSNSPEKLSLSKSGTTKINDVKPDAGRMQSEGKTAPVFDKISAAGNEQSASKQQTASQVQAENIVEQADGDKGQTVNEGKKNPALAADVIKKVQQQAKKLKIEAERGRALEATGRRSAVQGSQPTSALVQNSELLLRKPAVNVANLTPGKMISDAPIKIEAGSDADTPLSREAVQASEKGSKEIHLNEFKSTHLEEASGRKKFSRHLGELGRRQAGKSRETARQTTKWKQHRFVLKDGKAINISARSADGGLQLQLNTGNSELGKVLHQHLQEIQQHVQQELNIKIDLQLQDFSGQQSNRENETGSSSAASTKSSPNSGESSSAMAVSATSSGTERVRYFGFNNNEWTA